jgi:RimJ/RimL family protein N-acetyltransferase
VGIDWVSRLVELRIRIGDKNAWGGGLGSEATRLLLSYAFDGLNLERVWLRVFATNERAIKMYEKVGFQHEGRLRRASFINGQMLDVDLMGLLKTEYKQHTHD